MVIEFSYLKHIYYINGIYSSMEFLQTKPKTSNIDVNIKLSIKKYTNNIGLNRNRNGIIVDNYLYNRSIDRLIDIKNCINELNFNLDNIKKAQELIQSNLSELNLRLNHLKNNDIIGNVEIDKNNIEIESLSKLIELL